MPPQPTILVIDDDPDFLTTTAQILETENYRCCTRPDARGLEEQLSALKPDLVLTDFCLPDRDGMAVLRAVQAWRSTVPVIVLTGLASVATAVELTRAGAFDYLTKPMDPDQLLLRLAHAIEQFALRRENAELKASLKDAGRLDRMVGHSQAMQQVYKVIERIAPSEVGVFIQGESGTGKELVARAIHRLSPRAAKPFVAIDCVALPPHLVESELFGHEKGAFTGATQGREGLLESAADGTIFLDEITELAIDLQAKLLRVLQEKQFRRVGGRDLLPLRGRIVAASNRNLEQAVAEGILREDLYYRLNVVPINLPPLRRRRDDIPVLLEHFLLLQQHVGVPVAKRFQPEVLARLQGYAWPGNVRQLENLVQRLALLSLGDEITLADIPPEIRESAGADTVPDGLLDLPFKDARAQWMEAFERQYVEHLLKRHNGNISKAATEAGIDRKTIHRILKDAGERGDADDGAGTASDS